MKATLRTYNTAELAIMEAVRDQLKWYLGEEIGHDPETDPEAAVELEMRFAQWIVTGGGAWLRSLPEISEIYGKADSATDDSPLECDSPLAANLPTTK
jgi:hypothetical protein